ncbi:hypothetical protein PHYC_00245 [Phycisphaerales bacterium]|nr:hypothetical protein PHYC_00245 [Phycisphaerales bacterium]
MFAKLASILLFAGASASPGQDAVVLRPSTYSTTQGGEVRVAASAPAGPQTDWPADIEWFFVRLAGTQENRGPGDGPAPARGQPHRLSLGLPGAAMIGLDLKAATQIWPPAALSTFAARAGTEDPCAKSDARVQLLRSATTLVRVSDADGKPAADSTPTSKSGQQVEIRPLMDPTSMLPGGDLPVRLYMKGTAAGGGVISATHLESNTTQQATADSGGIALLHIERPGEYRLELRVLRPLAESDAAWQAGIATLTFEVPKPAEPALEAAPEKEDKP